MTVPFIFGALVGVTTTITTIVSMSQGGDCILGVILEAPVLLLLQSVGQFRESLAIIIIYAGGSLLYGFYSVFLTMRSEKLATFLRASLILLGFHAICIAIVLLMWGDVLLGSS